MDATGVPAPRRSPWFWAVIAFAPVPLEVLVWSFALWLRRFEPLALVLLGLFALIALAQVVLGVVAVVVGVKRGTSAGLGAALAGLCASAVGLAGGFYGALLGLMAAGGGWGRPLRVRGRQLHPELRRAATGPTERGQRRSLDPATRAALERCGCDAQKGTPPCRRSPACVAARRGREGPAEPCSGVPRRARESSMPGAASRSRPGTAVAVTAEPMPELLVGLDAGAARWRSSRPSPGRRLPARDFNPTSPPSAPGLRTVTRDVLLRIAAEERSHAEFSWAVLRWTLERSRNRVVPAVERALAQLPGYRRPTAVSASLRSLVSRAEPSAMRRHGRLPDERWSEVWHERLAATTRHARELWCSTPVHSAGRGEALRL
jgi:hypothetical protein